MKCKFKLLILMLLFMFLLTGCWDAYDIQDYSIITSSAVDIKNNNIEIYNEFITSKKGKDGSKNETATDAKFIIGKGNTAVEARNSYVRKYANNQFYGAARAVVLSNTYAESGIVQHIDRLRSFKQYSRMDKIFTTTADLPKLFNVKELGIESTGFHIAKLNDQLVKNGLFYEMTLNELLEASLVKNTGYILGNLDLVNNEIQLTGYSVFNNNKKIGLIEAQKMKGVNNLLCKKAQSAYTLDFEDATVSFFTLLKKRKIQAFYDDGQITFNIRLSLIGEIADTTKLIKTDDENMMKLSNLLSDTIKNDIENTLKLAQKEYSCDYLYMYKYFRAKYNTEFQKMNWNEEFKEAKFNVEVDAKAVPGKGISID